MRFAAALVRARPAEGSGLTALLRACGEIVHLGPVLGLIFADNALVDPDTWDTDESDDEFSALAARGQADGSIAADLPLAWVVTLGLDVTVRRLVDDQVRDADPARGQPTAQSHPRVRSRPVRMHADEVDIDVDLVRALVAGQFPELARPAHRGGPPHRHGERHLPDR